MSRRAVLFAASLLASFTACTYEWPAGTGPQDAAADAPTDATLVDRLSSDAPFDVAADAQPLTDAGPEGGVDCAALKAAVASKRGPAKQCPNIGPYCVFKIFDECDCESWVIDASSSAALGYESAIAALKASGCAIPCGTCPPRVAGGTCVLFDGGAFQACSP